MVATAPQLSGGVQSDEYDEYESEMEGLVSAQLEGRLLDEQYLIEKLSKMAVHYWKTFPKITDDFRERIIRRYEKGLDSFIDGMTKGRIGDVKTLVKEITDLAEQRFDKTASEIQIELGQRILFDFRTAHLTSEQLRVIAPEIRAYLGIEDTHL